MTWNSISIDQSFKRLIATQIIFPITLLTLGIYHGMIQVLYRAGVIQSNSFLGLEYYQGLTLHGVINAVVFTTFFAVAFGHAVILYFLRMGISKVWAWVSCWLMLIGTAMAAYAMLSGKASVLYTFYPPLKADPSFYIGATLLVVGSWIAFFSWIPAYLKWRKANPGQKTPMAVVGIFTTFIVWLFATLPLAVEAIFMLIPWSLGLVAEIHVPLARTLFWFFGHPLVYFWLLPAYTMYYAMLPEVAGGKLYSDYAGRLAFMLFIVFSAPIGLHHQYADPAISSSWKWIHGMGTFVVALPSFITAFTLAASLEFAARHRGGRGLFAWWGKLPYWEEKRWLFPYFFVGLVLFLYGGITGIINASVSMNNVVHNTSWVPGHFHTTVGGPVFLAFCGMSLFLITKILGKQLRFPRAAMAFPYLWIVGIMAFSLPMALSGLMGEPRRTNMGLSFTNPDSPLYNAAWALINKITILGGVTMTVASICFFVAFFGTLFSRKTSEQSLEFPVAQALHDEPAGILMNFKPWIIFGVLAFGLAYTPPLLNINKGTFNKAPAYAPDSPLPVQKK